MYELFVSVRYLWATRRRAHTAFLSLISTLGLVMSVATLLISLALLSGLQGKIKARLIASSPQMLIEPSGSNAIANAPDVIEHLRGRGVEVRRMVSGVAWASDPEGHHGQPVRVRSWEPGEEPEAETSFGREWRVANEGERALYLSRDLANAFGIFLGDDIVVVSPRTKLTPFGPAPVWRKFRIARILPAEQSDGLPPVWISYDQASKLFGTGGEPTSIEVYGPVEKVDALRGRLEQTFPDLLVKDWREINKPLFLALRLEKVVMFVTISLIVLVAALNLVSSLSMLIVEKRPQIGILRTLGATNVSILRIFLGVGLLIGLAGTAIGNLIGIGFSLAANHWALIPLPRDIYYLDHLPFSVDAIDVLAVNVIAILLSIAATWYPARVAASLDPVAAIREE